MSSRSREIGGEAELGEDRGEGEEPQTAADDIACPIAFVPGGLSRGEGQYRSVSSSCVLRPISIAGCNSSLLPTTWQAFLPVLFSGQVWQ